MKVADVKEFVVSTLASGLSPTLYYHGLHHTLDVVDAADRLARAEGITDAESLDLLQTAALFHDIGFLFTYKGHEETGCDYARQELPRFDYDPAQIEAICGMIRATQIPQQPRTKLEEILADADLDYLGRDDFDPIAHSLYQELKARDMVTDEMTWNRIQVGFLTSHHYWTATAVATRQDGKQQRLDGLRVLVGG